MRYAQTCRGACQECALPQTSTVSGHVMSEVGSAREENQEVETLSWFDQQQYVGTGHNKVVVVCMGSLISWKNVEV